MGAAVIALPWPPSLNRYYRNVGGRTLISKAGREYRRAVCEIAARSNWPRHGAARLRVSVWVQPPDRRRRDLDNISKSVLDALTHAGVWDDDSQIDALHIERAVVCPGGRLLVVIEAGDETK